MSNSMRATNEEAFDTRTNTGEALETLFDAIADRAIVATEAITDVERELISCETERQPNAGLRGVDYASRLLDLSVALALIVLLLPIMLLTALAIMIADPGPVLFMHRRVGKNGKEFRCLKFRTMHHGAEDSLTALLSHNAALRQEWAQCQKLTNDPRVTPLGHLLRNTCLDELPQLFNVLRGDMGLVGPRPIVEAELSHYGRYASSYMSVRPGLTGLWQITRSDDTSYRRRVATDVVYVRRRSILLDCRILLGTIPAVLTGNGAC